MRRPAFGFSMRAMLGGELAKSAALIFVFAAVSLLPIAAGLAVPGTGGKESGEVAGFLCLVVAIVGGVLVVRSAGESFVSCLAFAAGVVSALYLAESFPFSRWWFGLCSSRSQGKCASGEPLRRARIKRFG